MVEASLHSGVKKVIALTADKVIQLVYMGQQTCSDRYWYANSYAGDGAQLFSCSVW